MLAKLPELCLRQELCEPLADGLAIRWGQVCEEPLQGQQRAGQQTHVLGLSLLLWDIPKHEQLDGHLVSSNQ